MRCVKSLFDTIGGYGGPLDRLYIKGIYTFLGLHEETQSSCTCFPTCWRSIGPPLRNYVLVEVEMFKIDDYIYLFHVQFWFSI